MLTAAAASTSQAAGHDAMGRALDKAPTPDLFTVVIEPGGGANCQSSPCRIYYRTPDLGAPVQVIVNNFTVGTFAPGKYADLGNYNDPTIRITVPGGDVPTAYVNIADPGNSS